MNNLPRSEWRAAHGVGFLREYGYLLPYVWAVMVMFLATTYAFPQTDDFCTFGRLFGPSQDNPFIETWNIYHSWTGRYTSTFLITVVGWSSSVIPLPLHVSYRGALILILITYVSACFVICRALFTGRHGSAALAMLIVAASLVLMPSKLEEFIWLTGAVVYFVSISLLLLLMGLIDGGVHDHDEGRSHIFNWWVVGLLVAGVGINEFIALAIGCYLMLRFALYAHSRAFRMQNIVYFSVYILALGLTIFAPGNFARDAGITATHHSVLGAIHLALSSFSVFLDMHVRPNPLLLTCLLLISFLAGFGVRKRNRTSADLKRVLAVCITLVVSFPMHLLVYSYLAGEESPGRIINEAYPLALIGVCIFLSDMGARLNDRLRVVPMALVKAAIFSVGIMLLASGQLRQVVTVMRDFGPVWSAEQLNRIALATQAAKDKRPLTVPAFSLEGSSPPLLEGADISGDKKYWVNQCVASFYSLPSIESTPRK